MILFTEKAVWNRLASASKKVGVRHPWGSRERA